MQAPILPFHLAAYPDPLEAQLDLELPGPEPELDEATFGERVLELLERQAVALELLSRLLVRRPHRVEGEAVAPASGLVQIDFPVDPGGVNLLWLIERVGPWTNTSATTVSAGVYIVDVLPSPPGTAIDARYQVDFTNYAQVFGDEINPPVAEGGEHVVFQWTGLNQGDRCIARMQYRVAWLA